MQQSLKKEKKGTLPFEKKVLAMVGVVARVVIKIKIDITNGFGIWLF
jgi:hypothetical protein